jgi:hypothetical protein
LPAVRAGPERLRRRLGGALAGLDLRHLEPLLAQALEMGALVLAPALGHQLGIRARDPLQQDLATRAGEIQGGAVLAGEEVVEVAR